MECTGRGEPLSDRTEERGAQDGRPPRRGEGSNGAAGNLMLQARHRFSLRQRARHHPRVDRTARTRDRTRPPHAGRPAQRPADPAQGEERSLAHGAVPTPSRPARIALPLARTFVRGKIANALALLTRQHRNYPQRGFDGYRRELRRVLDKVEIDASLESLRGLEGQAARTYFTGFGLACRADLAFEGRRRRAFTFCAGTAVPR